MSHANGKPEAFVRSEAGHKTEGIMYIVASKRDELDHDKARS